MRWTAVGWIPHGDDPGSGWRVGKRSVDAGDQAAPEQQGQRTGRTDIDKATHAPRLRNACAALAAWNHRRELSVSGRIPDTASSPRTTGLWQCDAPRMSRAVILALALSAACSSAP